MRRRLQGVRRAVHAAPPAGRPAADAMPRVPQAGAQGLRRLLHAEDFQEVRRESGDQRGLHGAEETGQGRIRDASPAEERSRCQRETAARREETRLRCAGYER